MFSPFGPGGAETLIANMLGIKPGELATMLTEFRDLVISTKETMERIESKCDLILGNGKVLENDNGSDGDGDRGSGDNGRGRGDSGTITDERSAA